MSPMGCIESTTARQLESVTLNTWPGLQTYILDGWIVQYSDGFTKRANSVYPLWDPTGETEPLIERCETFYEDRGQPTVFKLTGKSQPITLNHVLADRGYRCTGETSVRLKSLDDDHDSVDERMTLETGLPSSFVETYSRLWNLSEGHTQTFREMMRSSLCDTVCATLEMDGKSVACGLALLDQEFVGLLGIHVDESIRRQGLGEAITTALLREGQIRGAETAWLQVETENTGASTLYESLGFSEAYRYWYRMST